ncbi:MAG: NADH-quinone oxidoreductase subunit NuoE [Phycisphaeraceae bacterium]|nr:NADH-quinone oxidoreductase subunit NuoE [Phycisphaeraceae bacterium]
MPWITKNSGSMQIETRDEPYLDDALKAELEANIITRYPDRRAAMLPTLHAVQHKVGWLPAQALKEIGEFLGTSPAQVMDTASFYEEYWLKPKGKYVVWVCQSITCELMDRETLMSKVKAKLGIEPGQTTDDGKFTLMNVECLGSCGTAPCALVNEKLHENLSADNVEAILDSLE